MRSDEVRQPRTNPDRLGCLGRHIVPPHPRLVRDGPDAAWIRRIRPRIWRRRARLIRFRCRPDEDLFLYVYAAEPYRLGGVEWWELTGKLHDHDGGVELPTWEELRQVPLDPLTVVWAPRLGIGQVVLSTHFYPSPMP